MKIINETHECWSKLLMKKVENENGMAWWENFFSLSSSSSQLRIHPPYWMVKHITRADTLGLRKIRVMSKLSARIVCETFQWGIYYSSIMQFSSILACIGCIISCVWMTKRTQVKPCPLFDWINKMNLWQVMTSWILRLCIMSKTIIFYWKAPFPSVFALF